MKRIFLILTIACGALMMAAQSRLHIEALFDGRYQNSPSATEVLVTGSKAQKLGLSEYHSLTLTDAAQLAAVEQAVTRDGLKAKEKEVEYRGGHLYYGFYVLQPAQATSVRKKPAEPQRYLFYLNQSLARTSPVDKVTLIYMRGYLSVAEVRKLIGR